MKRFFLFFTILFCLSSAISAFATPLEDEDAAFWLRTDAEKKLGEDWKVTLGEELRFREHAGITYADTHLGASWQACQYFLIGGEYLQIRQTRTAKGKDRWFWEARPRFYLTPQIKVKGWKLEDRNMLELRVKEQIRDSLRYRNRVTLTAPWKWTRFEFQPTVFNEVFFESHRNGMTEDRLFTGFKMHLWKPFYGTIGYMRQFSKSASGWKDSNVTSISLKAVF